MYSTPQAPTKGNPRPASQLCIPSVVIDDPRTMNMDAETFVHEQLPGRTATRDVKTIEASTTMLNISDATMVELARNGLLRGAAAIDINATDIERLTSHMAYTIGHVLASEKIDSLTKDAAMKRLFARETEARNLAQYQLHIGSRFHGMASSEKGDSGSRRDPDEEIRASLAWIRAHVGEIPTSDAEMDFAKMSALHQGRQIIAQAQTHCVLSHLAPHLRHVLDKRSGELSSWLKNNAKDNSQELETISEIEQLVHKWAAEFTAASTWLPDDRQTSARGLRPAFGTARWPAVCCGLQAPWTRRHACLRSRTSGPRCSDGLVDRQRWHCRTKRDARRSRDTRQLYQKRSGDDLDACAISGRSFQCSAGGFRGQNA
jgi:hypothetical protein